MDKKKLLKKAEGASAGLAVAVAFLNVALLVTQLVKTVISDDDVTASSDEAETEENY